MEPPLRPPPATARAPGSTAATRPVQTQAHARVSPSQTTRRAAKVDWPRRSWLRAPRTPTGPPSVTIDTARSPRQIEID